MGTTPTTAVTVVVTRVEIRGARYCISERDDIGLSDREEIGLSGSEDTGHKEWRSCNRGSVRLDLKSDIFSNGRRVNPRVPVS